MKTMNTPFSKSVSTAQKCNRLREIVSPEDSLTILMEADPDAMASALALKRFFWRRVKTVKIAHINKVERADNLAFIRQLDIKQQNIRQLRAYDITKWALVDSQPDHHEEFRRFDFDIIIDHHPVADGLKAKYIDIREHYGANATILTEYLRAVNIIPSPRIATALFFGIKTDTDNFIRDSVRNDINAFRYLYKYANLNTIKKIESSEITQGTLSNLKTAIDSYTLVKQTVHVHMGQVSNADVLVIIADFFLKMAEATWSIISGVSDKKLIIVIRNAGFRRSAGSLAKQMFGDVGFAGGHRNAARVEIPIQNIQGKGNPAGFILDRIRKRRKGLN
jgi:nanoRNase/pAp phosphatase (c-di-AMP/oligoRNAs hydrolase)